MVDHQRNVLPIDLPDAGGGLIVDAGRVLQANETGLAPTPAGAHLRADMITPRGGRTLDAVDRRETRRTIIVYVQIQRLVGPLPDGVQAQHRKRSPTHLAD